MKNSSFGKKLLFLILGITLVIFGLTMFFVSKFSYETAESDAKKFVEISTKKYSAEVEALLNISIVISKTMASKFEESLNNNVKLNEQETINYFKSILKNNPNFIGIWFKNDPKELFFKENNESKGKNGYDKIGQFNPYVVRVGNDYKVNSGSPYSLDLEWISEPMKRGREYITQPYLYPVNGVKVLMTGVSVPMYYKNKFIGTIGIDIALDSIDKMVSKIKIFDNGYAFVVDSFGKVIGHPTKKYLSKELLSISNRDENYIKLLDNAKDGKSYMFMKESLKGGLHSMYYSNPFEIGNTKQNWIFAISAPVDEYLANANFIRNFSIISFIAGLLIIGLVMFFIIRKLNHNLSSISKGLNSFFKYLNKETTTSTPINIISNDEFGQMAKNVNNNIERISKSIEEDSLLIEDVKKIVNNVSKGHLDLRIKKESSTESLNELKRLLNDMLNNLESLVGNDLNKITDVLSKYSSRDFTATLDSKSSGAIGNKIIEMNNMITEILNTNQNDGNTLQGSAKELTQNVSTLSNNATSQAASLEETAASIDEITSNIEQTSQKAQEMSAISNDTKKSAKEGQKLASDTVQSMDEINETVISINEAISVIDQIAFQTNILSLNAAVEAATAGESGKGFAVVAQEVRNLASRSAEAAKEIKELVENATTKTNNGKEISTKMIEGFNHLEIKISDTNKLIDDVTNAAKEQSIGMSQVSDAVNQLDRFTQENASIADRANIIAKETNDIAQEVVINVNKNNFEGKGSFSSLSNIRNKENKMIESKDTKSLNKKVTSKDEWESF